MRGLIGRLIVGCVYFSINLLIWFIAPLWIERAVFLGFPIPTSLLYIGLLIAILSGISGFYRGTKASIVFSICAEVALIYYILHVSNFGLLTLHYQGISIRAEFTTLLFILLLPVIFSLVMKVWRISTIEAEKRLPAFEEIEA